MGLKLNLQVSQTPLAPLQITLGNSFVATKKSARCLGTQWRNDLSARDSINTNIFKARRAFFGLGSTGVFHGKLNSSSSMFETCIIPVLLFGCKTWLLDTICLQALERFQCEVGRRILKLSKYHSGDAIRIVLQWPLVSTRILKRKLSFLSKLLSNSKDSMSLVFSPLWLLRMCAVSQCHMLEASLNIDIVYQYLKHPQEATAIVH